MKKLILALVSATSLATRCELPENWKRFNEQAGHVLAIGATTVSIGFAAATGTTTIAAVTPIVVGAAVIAAHTMRMNDNKKLAEEQKLLKIEIAPPASIATTVLPAESPTDVTKKGA